MSKAKLKINELEVILYKHGEEELKKDRTLKASNSIPLKTSQTQITLHHSKKMD